MEGNNLKKLRLADPDIYLRSQVFLGSKPAVRIHTLSTFFTQLFPLCKFEREYVAGYGGLHLYGGLKKLVFFSHTFIFHSKIVVTEDL